MTNYHGNSVQSKNEPANGGVVAPKHARRMRLSHFLLFFLMVVGSSVNSSFRVSHFHAEAFTDAFKKRRDEVMAINFENELDVGYREPNEDVPDITNNIRRSEKSGMNPRARLNKLEGFCSREQLQTGQWLPVVKEKPPYVSSNRHLRCYPIKAYTQGKWETHEWRPSATCEFSAWRSKQFCALMKFSTILIVGDSLSWEQYASLGQLLGQSTHQTSQHESKAKNQNHVQYACKGQVRLAFRRDDRLGNLTHAIESTFPNVIVANRGAHYQDDTHLMAGIHHNIDELRSWEAKCEEAGIKCHLFWRTSVPGHPHCDKVNFTTPINNIQEMEAWIGNRSNYDNHTVNYHWFDYQHQNELVVDLLSNGLVGKGVFEVLDAYYLNVLRPDEHRAHQGDCLHSCYPGKMDVYNQLMLHFLKSQRHEDDIVDLRQILGPWIKSARQ